MAENKKIKIKYDDIAVAIQYIFGKDGEVPKIVASGRGYMAHQIVELAKEHKVPLKEDKAVAESLAKVSVGIEIPPELWSVMAEILAQVYRLDQQQKS